MSGDNELAFIGLGGMGGGMALCLRAAGFPLVVYNRTAAKSVPLAEAGARVAASIGDAGRDASIVLLSLSDEAAVEQVLFGELAGRLRPGALVVDTSTVSPAYSADASERLAKVGARRLEACVIGNPPMARAGQLRIFTAGGSEEADEARGVLEALGQEIVHVGPAGSACALKLSFNLILGNQIAALAEAAQLAVSAGVDRDLFFTAVAKSGFSSPALAFRAELMRTRRYEPPAFRSTLMEKDLRLAVSGAAAHDLELPVTAGVAERFGAAIRAGDGDKDAAAIAELRASVH
ncbi:NAD(P)-dependent oxidoreductase [Nonomuraea cypriaca]|uniref:NAD(P)-dependent oxidoreductase n=1 Tax=Nonomuraea cypriaca TaxID=1187855 RepID=UPI002E2A358C|nr:NAD(P)-dependent oxidoreductase [Nonomuraea cypriaca]